MLNISLTTLPQPHLEPCIKHISAILTNRFFFDQLQLFTLISNHYGSSSTLANDDQPSMILFGAEVHLPAARRAAGARLHLHGTGVVAAIAGDSEGLVSSCSDRGDPGLPSCWQLLGPQGGLVNSTCLRAIKSMDGHCWTS